MKKLLFMVLVFMVSFQNSVFAVATEVKSVVKQSTAERLIDKYSEKIVNQLTIMANKLEGPAKELFHSLVLVEVSRGLIGPIMLLIAIIFLWLFIKESNKIKGILSMENPPSFCNPRGGIFDSHNDSILLYVYIIGGLAFLSIGLVVTLANLDHLIAPQWFAVQDLVKLFK